MKAVLLIVLLSLATVALAYKLNSDWVQITSTSSIFWTSSNPNPSEYLDVGESHIFEWIVTASGPVDRYELMVNVTSNNPNVTLSNTILYFNGTIYDKGNSSGIIPNYTCTGCAFNITHGGTTMANPYEGCGNMSENDNCVIEWNVSAPGPVNTTWDIFVNFEYNSTTSPQNSSVKKVRIVDYPWWNTSWNCRRMVNVHSDNNVNTVEFRNITFDDVEACRMINCTNEIRVTEINGDWSQSLINNVTVLSPNYLLQNATVFCENATIRFNVNMTGDKHFFVYFNNPIAEKDYNPATLGSLSYNATFDDTEFVWDLFYNSHNDFYWEDATDGVSLYAKEATNIVYNSSINLGYKPQVTVNKQKNNFKENIHNDIVYWYFGHGNLNLDPYNQNRFDLSPSEYITAYEITNLTNDISAKFVMIISCFGGDNSTTLTGCSLTNWLSKAFIDKGAECYLSVLGTSDIQDCQNCDCDSGTYVEYTGPFNTCFWNEISQGDTILQAKVDADTEDCGIPQNCGPGNDESCVHPILVERYVGACNQTLIK